MSEQTWLQQDGEPNDAYTKFVVYLGLGPSRSLTEAYRQTGKIKKTTKHVHISPQFSKMAQQWRWVERSQDHDSYLSDMRLRDEEALLHEQVLSSGWALDHHRILALEELAVLLQNDIKSGKHRISKQIGYGPQTQVIEELDEGLIRQYRGVIEDIAKEVGGRAKRSEVTGANGGPIQIITETYLPQPEYEDDYEEVEDGQWQ